MTADTSESQYERLCRIADLFCWRVKLLLDDTEPKGILTGLRVEVPKADRVLTRKLTPPQDSDLDHAATDLLTLLERAGVRLPA